MRLILTISLLISVSFGSDSCTERLVYLESKVDRILNILESTFRTSGNYATVPINDDAHYGAGKAQSGGIAGYVDPKTKLNSKRGNDHGNIGVAGLVKAGQNDYHERGHAYVDSDNEVKLHGHNDEVGYLGAHVNAGNAAALEAYGKDEAYLADNQDGYVFEADYSGARTNDSIIAQRRNIVRESQTINEEFVNDYAKENHAGDYKGNEFDLGYKTKEAYGGFNDIQSNKEMEQNRYYDAANENDIYNKGNKYDKEIYTKEDQDKDYYGRNVALSGPDGKPKGGHYGDYNANLYDKYTGKDTGKKDGAYGPAFGYQTEREYADKESDLDERFHGNEYNGNDKYGKSVAKEDNIGVKSRLDAKTQYNQGRYADVEAKGHNKNANYKGDYQTNKEARKTGYTFRNDESVEEIGTPDRFNVAIINDNRVEYRGKERKSSINADRKQGKYTDREVNSKLDANKNAKRLRGNDYYGKKERSREDDIYYDAKKRKRFC